MPLTVADLPTIDPGDVSDDDYLLIYDVGGGAAYKITKSNFLSLVAMEGGDHDFDEVTINDLTAPVAEISALTIAASLTFPSTSALTNAYVGNLSFTFTSISSGASQTQTATLAGAATADFLVLALTAALADGLTYEAWISAANTVSLKIYNHTGGGETPGGITGRAIAFKAS